MRFDHGLGCVSIDFLSLVRRIGALGVRFDRGLGCVSIGALGVRFDRGLGAFKSTSNARSPDRSTGCEVDCFFFVLSLSLACCVFCFFSPSLCVLQATEMN